MFTSTYVSLAREHLRAATEGSVRQETVSIDSPSVPLPTSGNRLLSALPAEDWAMLGANRRFVTAQTGSTVLDAHEPPADALFPLPGTVLSLLVVMPERKPVETAIVGCEGAAGALFGSQQAALGVRVQVLTGGGLIRIPAALFGEALAASPTLRERMTLYVSALMAQLQYAAACAALHPVEARASRWMLALQDRLGDRALPLTQEVLADLLGVRRTTITRVVAALEERGLVRHRRGRIIVMDRPGLEGASCPCHGLVRTRFEATAPGLYPAALQEAAE